MKANNKKKRHWGLILFLALLIILLGVLGINYKHFASRQLNPIQMSKTAASSATVKESTSEIVGAYRDDQDGAAIVLEENGTGRYVYADKHNPDTDDALTWKKQGDHYLINLKDDDVTNPLTATLDQDKLVITGSNGWNTETFQRTTGSFDLQEFLAEMHKK